MRQKVYCSNTGGFFNFDKPLLELVWQLRESFFKISITCVHLKLKCQNQNNVLFFEKINHDFKRYTLAEIVFDSYIKFWAILGFFQKKKKRKIDKHLVLSKMGEIEIFAL